MGSWVAVSSAQLAGTARVVRQLGVESSIPHHGSCNGGRALNRFVVDHLITMAGDPEVLSPGVVDIDEGRVVWAGASADAPDYDGPVETLAGLLLPGFVNTHAHSPMVLLRGAGEGLPVDRWLTEVMWPREGRLTPEDVWWGMTLGAAELLGNGITTSHEHYFFADRAAEAAAAIGLRAVVTAPVLIGADLSRFGPWEQQIQDMEALADRWADHALISIGLGPHAAYSLPEEALRAVVELARRRSLHIQIHVAEGPREGDGIADQYGMTVPAYLEWLGMLECRMVAAHCVWLTDDDIALFARHEVGVAHCPMSNGKHASGIAPVTDMRAAGIPVGIATDGPSSHDRLDLFEEMRAALRYARLRSGDAGAMTPADVLTMTTREAADVLGRPDLGRLVPGSRADMILIDTDPLGPVLEPCDLITHVVYSGTPDHVRAVWVEGRQVVADGRPATVDIDAARREVTTRAARLAAEA